MPYALFLIVAVVRVALSVLNLTLLARAILSWIPVVPENGFLATLLYAVSEPFIYPFRLLFHKMGWFEDMPLDMPFLFTVIALSLITAFL